MRHTFLRLVFAAGVALFTSREVSGQANSCQHSGSAQPNEQLAGDVRASLFAAREAVWRAYFTADSSALMRLLPAQMTAMPRTRSQIIEDSRAFVQGGGRFVGIDFSDDRVFLQGDVAVVWSRYVVRLTNAKNEAQRDEGCAIELFVRRDGAWINPHWHLDHP